MAAGRLDTYGFTVSFKGVLLEGLEVVFIVITFGANQGQIGLAALGAGAAVLIVLGIVLMVRAPLSRVPENTMKFAVGCAARPRSAPSGAPRAPAWSGPAATSRSPCSSPRRCCSAWRWWPRCAAPRRCRRCSPAGRGLMRQVRAFALFWWDFIVGDDYRIALAVVVLLAATALLSRAGIAVWWLLPAGVLAMLATSVFTAARRQTPCSASARLRARSNAAGCYRRPLRGARAARRQAAR